NKSLVITKDNYQDTSINLNLPNNNPYTQFLLDNHKQIGYLKEDQYSNAFEWSNDGESLAVYLGDKIILWKIKYIDNYKDIPKTTESSTQTTVYKRSLEIIEKKEITHKNTPKSGNVRLFFSGNDEFLYFSDD